MTTNANLLDLGKAGRSRRNTKIRRLDMMSVRPGIHTGAGERCKAYQLPVGFGLIEVKIQRPECRYIQYTEDHLRILAVQGKWRARMPFLLIGTSSL
jgi:hypothetical protein